MEAVALAHWVPSIAALAFIIIKDWYDARKMRQAMNEVRGQIKNNHPNSPNLRDDIDGIREAVHSMREVQHDMRNEQREFRTEIRDALRDVRLDVSVERQARAELARRIEGQV